MIAIYTSVYTQLIIQKGVCVSMDIKPCPHCGGAAYINSHYSGKTKRHYVYVKCDVCGAQGKLYASMEDPSSRDWDTPACIGAVKAWNMRTGAEVQS